MNDTNVTTIVGRLTKDADLKRDAGLPVGFFTIATNRRKRNGASGNFADEASFIDVNVYGKYAELITPSLKKGAQACVVGSLKQERWRDASGQNRSRLVITADSVQIFGGGGRDN